MLLLGVYKHGLKAYEEVRDDPELAFGCLRGAPLPFVAIGGGGPADQLPLASPAAAPQQPAATAAVLPAWASSARAARCCSARRGRRGRGARALGQSRVAREREAPRVSTFSSRARKVPEGGCSVHLDFCGVQHAKMQRARLLPATPSRSGRRRRAPSAARARPLVDALPRRPRSRPSPSPPSGRGGKRGGRPGGSPGRGGDARRERRRRAPRAAAGRRPDGEPSDAATYDDPRGARGRARGGAAPRRDARAPHGAAAPAARCSQAG